METDDMFTAGNQATVRWIYRRVNHQGKPGRTRRVDVFKVGDGKAAGKMAGVTG